MEELNLGQVTENMLQHYVRNTVSACIGKSEVVKDIFSEIIMATEGYVPIASVEFNVEDNDEDVDYLLTLELDGIRVTTMNKDIYYFTDYLYIQNDCNSRYLQNAIEDPKRIYVFEVEACNGDCANCSYCDDVEDDEAEETNYESGDMHGFSMSKTDEFGTRNFSFYSQDVNMVEEMRKDWKQYLGE